MRTGFPKSGGVADVFGEIGTAKLKMMSARQGRTEHNCLRCSDDAAQIEAAVRGFAVPDSSRHFLPPLKKCCLKGRFDLLNSILSLCFQVPVSL